MDAARSIRPEAEMTSPVGAVNVPPPVPVTVSCCVPVLQKAPPEIVAVGVGFTVTVKFTGVPVQPLADGVTLMVAIIGLADVLTAVKPLILPVPLPARPMDGVLLVQLKVEPATVLVKFKAFTGAPLQTITFAGTVTVGVGFTVMVKVCAVPAQPLAEGVTVIVAVTGAFEVFTPLKAGMFPEPEPARPMDVLLFVQLKVVPVTGPLKPRFPVVTPLQIVTVAGTTTVGVGLTVTVKVLGVPGQPFTEGVTVTVATTCCVLVLVAV